MPSIIPSVSEKSAHGERIMDIYSQLHKNRVIMLDGPVTDQSASLIIAQMLQLEFDDPDADIILYINSPGGSVSAGLAIHDTMNYISCDVSTISMGLSASMGAFLLCSGAKGKRFSLPNSEILIHQPLISGGGISGQCTDIEIHAKQMIKTRDKLETLIAEYTGNSLDVVHTACERDNYLTPEEAKAFGLIDDIITKRPKI